jgi:hypothetical protein
MAKFAQGKFIPKNYKKYVGKGSPTYRSGWEFAFMKFCDNHPSVTEWASEPMRIPYRNPLTGKQTTYVPDFLIVYQGSAGKRQAELIEVKPKSQTLMERAGKSKYNQAHVAVNHAKWEAAYKWCKQQGIRFRIVTEDDIFHQGGKRK